MSRVALTGERLADEDQLYGADLARHRAAYAYAIDSAAGRVLDLGCGTGYGAAELAGEGLQLVALDRVRPSASARRSSARFVLGDLNGLPFAPASFDWIVSFQVIEHLVDPTPYLRAIASLLRPEGTALITTPNLLRSDRENPYHVHEYEAEELAEVLRGHFAAVEMRGVGTSEAAARYHDERLARIRRITRLDPLGLRRRLPQGLVEWLFARLALLVRLGIRRGGGGIPELDRSDFPIGPADADCLDLLAICRLGRDGPEGSAGAP